jgi:hypothetical protein
MTSTFERWRSDDESWLATNRELAEIAFQWLMREGEWPRTDDLQRYLFQRGVRTLNVQEAADSRPHLPVQHAMARQERLILGARYLLDLPSARPLLDLVVAATLEAVEAYKGPSERPSVRYDNPKFFGFDSLTVIRLPGFTGSDHPDAFAGGSVGDQWDLLVDGALVTEFEGITRPENYVERQLAVIRGWIEEQQRHTDVPSPFAAPSPMTPTGQYPQRSMPLDVARCRSELDELESELMQWSQPNPPGLHHWRDRLYALIGEIRDPKDSLAIRLSGLRWSASRRPLIERVGSVGWADKEAFERDKATALDIIKTLRWDLDRMPPATAPFSDATVDPELWQHVKGLVEDGDWEKVAREAAVFVETKLRDWASVPPSVTGSVNVFKAAISADGFVLGSEGHASEVEGWRLLATGFALALRNPSGHRIADRVDAERYALGVLGTASLFLTQIRHEYGDPPTR